MKERQSRAEVALARRLEELANRGDGDGVRQELEWFQQSRCGARTKSRGGRPCRLRALAAGRCRHHGGCSTGPRSLAGRIRALTNLRPFAHLKDAPFDVAYAALAHLLERDVKEPSRRPPKRPKRGKPERVGEPGLVELVRRMARLS